MQSNPLTNLYQQQARISSVKFGVINDSLCKKLQKSELSNFQTDNDVQDGLFDSKLGSLSNHEYCKSCDNEKSHCQGHSGYIQCKFYYILPNYVEIIKQLLKKLCFHCIRLSGQKKCTHCGAPLLQQVKFEGYNVLIGSQLGAKPQLIYNLYDIKEKIQDLAIKEVRQFINICEHPSDLIVNTLFITSPMIRPNRKNSQQYNNNDELTTQLQSIIQTCFALNKIGPVDPQFPQTYNTFLQQITAYQRQTIQQGKPVKSLATVLMTKDGLLRNNMLGKKSDKMSRAVITCDSTIPINSVIIPRHIAMTLTISEYVSKFNFEKLQKLFNNGPDTYPGANYIIKSDQQKYSASNINVKLEIGDIIQRHLQSGDFVLMNRQPTMLPESICGHQVIVDLGDVNNNTIKINILSCKLYNADFDGDEMVAIGLQNNISVQETKYITNVSNQLISVNNASLNIPQVQDSVIGGYWLTQQDVLTDKVFIRRLLQYSTIDTKLFSQDFLSGPQLLSLLLPKQNFEINTSYYNSSLSKYIQYNDNDKQLKIILGEIKSGYFDQNSNHFYKQIVQTNNSDYAINVIYSIQQLTLQFNQYKGNTIGIQDLYVPKDKRDIINEFKSVQLQKGQEILYNFVTNNGQVSKSNKSYDELQQQLFDNFFDDMLGLILTSIEPDNNLLKMALTGTKGKLDHIKGILINLGYAQGQGQYIVHEFDNRLNLFYKKFDINPKAYGAVQNSYSEGLSPSELALMAVPTREGILRKVLSVAKGGVLGRKLKLNLEQILVSNTRLVTSHINIVQFLYGNQGFKVQSYCQYKIDNYHLSEADYIHNYIQFVKNQSSQLIELCTKQAKLIYSYIKKHKYCQYNFQLSIFGDIESTIQIPLQIKSLYLSKILQQEQKSDIKYIAGNIKLLNHFVDNLKYIYFNDNMMAKQKFIPQLYENGLFLIKLAIMTLFTPQILSQFNEMQFQYLLINDIKLQLLKNLTEYGTGVGMLSGMSLHEVINQDYLDSIHNIQQSANVKPMVEIVDDILKAKSQHVQKTQPILTIPFKQGVTEEQAQNILLQLQFMKLIDLVNNWQIIFIKHEKLDDPNYQYKNDAVFVDKSKLNNNKLTQICIRIELNSLIMQQNKLTIQQLVDILQNTKEIICLYSEDLQLIRCYLLDNEVLSSLDGILQYAKDISQTYIKGLQSLSNVQLSKNTHSEFDNNTGIITKHNIYVIKCKSRSLDEILLTQQQYGDYINYLAITCDNPLMMQQWYGKVASKKIALSELFNSVKKVDKIHLGLIIDYLSYKGKLSTYEQIGLIKNNKHDQLLQMAMSKPVQLLQKFSLSNKQSHIGSLSSQILIGQQPQIGTNFNQFYLNTNMIRQLSLQQQETIHVDDISI